MNKYFQCISMPVAGLTGSLIYLALSNIEISTEESLTINTKKNLKPFKLGYLINPGLFMGFFAVGTRYLFEKLYISKLK